MFIFRPVSRTVNANKVYVFDGGDGANGRVRVQSYNGLTLSTIAQNFSQSIIEACSTYVGSTNYMFGGYGTLNGGSSQGILNIIRQLDSSEVYSTNAATLTAPTRGASAGVLTASSTAYIFGGNNSGGTPQNTVWSFNGTTLINTGLIAPVLSYRGSSSHPGGNIYLFGGYAGSNSFSSSISEFSGSMGLAGVQLATEINSPAVAYFSSNSFIFGGARSGAPYYVSTIQRFTGTAISTDSATLPHDSSRATASGANDKGYLFMSGTGGTTNRFKIYQYDGTTYSIKSQTLANDGGGESYCSSQSSVSATAVV